MNTFAKDYIEVHERMAEFYARYPDGSLQGSWEWAADGSLIVYRAEAYRAPDDSRPGVGYAQEVFPGRTPYTKGSELMNAETSAWGRALAALGIATKRGIASAHEVRAAKSRQEPALDLDELTREIAAADLPALRAVWATWHQSPQWAEIEPLVADRRAQLEAT